MDFQALKDIISFLAEAPDGQLAEPLARECKHFVPEDYAAAMKFLRTLRSKAVYTGGASQFVMDMFHVVCDNPPEPEEERKSETS